MNELQSVSFTSGAHLNLIVFDNASASLLNTFVQILLRYHDTNTRSQSFNLQATVSDLGQEFLSNPHFINRI